MPLDQKNPRLARLQAECQVRAAPALLLAATCIALALWSAVQLLSGDAAPAQSAEQPQHISVPAA